VVLTVVDLFSKYARFIALGHPYSATSVTQAFFDQIVWLHGLPCSIMSDRDLVFTSAFWTELFHLSGVIAPQLCLPPPDRWTVGGHQPCPRCLPTLLAGDHPQS
jgi:hypothetical protein